MSVERLELPRNPREAVQLLKEASGSAPVLVFKVSPICPTSSWALAELRQWLAGRPDSLSLKLVTLDVLRDRELARGITAELAITHESPQALLFDDGELRWHASHEGLNEESFREYVDTRSA